MVVGDSIADVGALLTVDPVVVSHYIAPPVWNVTSNKVVHLNHTHQYQK